MPRKKVQRAEGLGPGPGALEHSEVAQESYRATEARTVCPQEEPAHSPAAAHRETQDQQRPWVGKHGGCKEFARSYSAGVLGTGAQLELRVTTTADT